MKAQGSRRGGLSPPILHPMIVRGRVKNGPISHMCLPMALAERFARQEGLG